MELGISDIQIFLILDLGGFSRLSCGNFFYKTSFFKTKIPIPDRLKLVQKSSDTQPGFVG